MAELFPGEMLDSEPFETELFMSFKDPNHGAMAVDIYRGYILDGSDHDEALEAVRGHFLFIDSDEYDYYDDSMTSADQS